MMKNRRVFGELEICILRLFKQYERLTVREVLKALKADDKYTTVMTVMNRMTEKQLLKRERTGQQFVYWLNSSQPARQFNLLNQLKDKIFGGKSVAMMSYLIETEDDLTHEDLNEMEELIARLKEAKKT